MKRSPLSLVCTKQARGKAPRAAPSGGVCQVVGLSSRFPSTIKHSAAAQSALPGASLFWHNQVLGHDLAEAVPYHRWDVDAAYAPNGGAGKAYDCLQSLICSCMHRELSRASSECMSCPR